MSLWLDQIIGRVTHALRRRAEGLVTSDQGDVPGWVMITLMSAVVVVALMAMMQDVLLPALENALNAVLP